MNVQRYDIAIIGAGIVGLGTTLALSARYPGQRLVVLEKEREPGLHQTGHNSGVLHSGIYYKPGTHKAVQCVEGARLMREFCAAHRVPVVDTGKVIVATDDSEMPGLEELYRRGTANGVPGLEMIGPERLREIEPHARGVRAIHAPHTACLDYGAVVRAMAGEARRAGVTIATGARVTSIGRRGDVLVVRAGDDELQAKHLINCAGLHADVVARLAGASPGVRIIPFRGEYYLLRPDRRDLVRGLIYPVPDPEFPFLGVHFTRTVAGDVEAGPNAVFAFAREGYSWGRINPGDTLGAFSYLGFWRMARRYWRMGVYEVRRSLVKAEFVRALQHLVPDLRSEDIVRGGAGVRAQAVTRDGRLVDDFSIVESPRAIHVLNAPSPAATASLAIGRHIAGLAGQAFGLRG
jgi:L-2-hydroxyglutarate oxidase LhgO